MKGPLFPSLPHVGTEQTWTIVSMNRAVVAADSGDKLPAKGQRDPDERVTCDSAGKILIIMSNMDEINSFCDKRY